MAEELECEKRLANDQPWGMMVGRWSLGDDEILEGGGTEPSEVIGLVESSECGFTKILGWYGCQIRFVFLVFGSEKWGD